MPLRKTLCSLVFSLATQFGSMAHGQTALPGITDQKIGTYVVTIGDAQITALSDGTVPQDLHALLHGTTNANTDALLNEG